MRLRLLVPALTLGCVHALAAEVEPKSSPPPATALPPIFAPKPPPKKAPAARPRLPVGAPPVSRAVSPEMAQKLSESVARIVPPAPTGLTKPAAATTETGEVSDAVLLDPFLVEEEKGPEFKQRELLTPKEKLELAYRNNPGLKAGRLPLGNDALAREMLETTFEEQRRAELKELGSVLKAGGVKPPPEVQRKIDEALTRKNGWLDQKPGTAFREPR